MEIESSREQHLDCNGLEHLETNASTNAALPQTYDTSKGSVRNACRLCLVEQNELQTDIFKRPLDEHNVETYSLAERLQELLHVKFENKSPLPQGICERCLFLVEAFTEFREQVIKCETELQQRFNELHLKYDNSALTPGLNGTPGEFTIDSDSEIVEVNVEQDYESSEDEFSMESDSEAEPNAQEKDKDSVVTHAENTSALPQLVNHTSLLPHALENAVTKTLCFLCQYCDMAFTTQLECHEHEVQAHDKPFPYTCHFCQARHTNRQSIIAHIRQTHQPDRPYICPLCSKGFCRRSDLKKHTIVHTGVRPYSCAICGKSFSRNTNLTKHIRIHNSTRPHVCQTCPRSFMTAQELAQHVVSHSEAKSYQCDQCPASYTRRDKLNLHKATHARQEAAQQYKQLQQLNSNIDAQMSHTADVATEIPYQQNKSILAAHLYQQQQPQQHRSAQSKSRSFICDICNRSFTRDQDLQRHRALHIDTLFKCNLCDVGFSRKEKLMRHIHEHHTPIYNCDICNISFTHAESLNMHMKVHQLQQFATYSAQTALNVVNNNLNANNNNPTNEVLPPQQLTPEEMSFYSQMVPTMNLGFYSETRPEA